MEISERAAQVENGFLASVEACVHTGFTYMVKLHLPTVSIPNVYKWVISRGTIRL
jgi:hypothetical protein